MEVQWSLVLFTFLTGAGGWTLACAAGNEFLHKSQKDSFRIVLAGLIVVVVGGCLSVTHLAHPDRIMNALSNPTSAIFTEAALVGIISVCAVVALLAYKRENAQLAKVFVVLAGVFGIVISFADGATYTVMNARAAWATMLLPLSYLATAAAAGIALYWALACPDEENGYGLAAKATGVAAIAGAVVTAIYGAAAGLFAGDALGYVGGSVVLDAVAALFAFSAMKKPSPAMVWGAVAAAVVAGVLMRVLMWVAGTGVYTFFG